MMGPETELLIDGPRFAEAAHKLCYYDLMALMEGLTFRLELIATAAAEGDGIREAPIENHRLG